jgi:hypothetical protein
MTWLQPPEAKYGGALATPAKPTTDATPTVAIQPVGRPSVHGLLSPGDPMFWFGVIAAGTVALMAYSTATFS